MESIVGKRIKSKALQYKVRWLGYGPAADTWEPLENLSSALTLVSAYEVSIWKTPTGTAAPPAPAVVPGPRPVTGRTLWKAEEDEELVKLVRKHGVMGQWETIAAHFSIARTGNALSKRWSKIKEQWENDEGDAAESSRGRKSSSTAERAAKRARRTQDTASTDAEWLAAIEVGSDVEVRPCSSVCGMFLLKADESALRWQVRDRQSWYECKVVLVEDSRVKIHFVGCGRRYDRWVARSHEHLRRLSRRGSSDSEDEDEEDEALSGSAGGEDRSVWTAAEDAELERLIKKFGSGNWAPMGDAFSGNRSANALRNRWMRLQQLGERGDDEGEPGVWSVAEDRELIGLVRQHGPRDWSSKESMLSTGRSANAIRKRWTKLEEDAAALEPAAGASDERVKIWNRKTERSHAGSAAPLRANLAKYLQEHPDCEVYNGQDNEDGPPPKANAVSPHIVAAPAVAPAPAPAPLSLRAFGLTQRM